MIRATTPDDTESLLALSSASGLFEPNELDQLTQMLQSYHDGTGTEGEFWLTDDSEGGVIGVAYCAPERMTEGTWNLYFIAVHPNMQRQGRGAAILDHLEAKLRGTGERVLLVETMGTSDFEPVRSFYRSAGYVEEARVRDFYRAGQDKVVYWKSLAAGTRS